MSDICPNVAKCPIFTGILKDRTFTTNAYKQLYCEAGLEGRNKCKRFQCKQKYGKVPDNLLPNSIKTLEEIGRENNWL
ncbi:hypothetical protein [Thermospira aquatica]|uniref:Uncharacterized protein n=1 Tax=Thermospira aquatica TaxID=2828656 RepID=A0AAX3BDZ0_9SPIR|nr:hypothetical protein [Thermospira aquatica]URA10343.1 hypothetical protein KDW03_00630 [Thermospira aquatica]